VNKRIGISVVKDTKSNHLIVKLVNLLPVEINTSINLDNFSIDSGTAVKTEITGNPSDNSSTPMVSEVNIRNPLKIPAYSFTVFKIKLER